MLHRYIQLYSIHKNRKNYASFVKTRFDTSNFKLDRQLLKGKN